MVFINKSKIHFESKSQLLEGDSIYTHKLDNNGIIMLGNKSKDISDEFIPYITNKTMIPRFTRTKPGIDSLNVSMAASIVFSEFLRRTNK